MAGRLHLCAPNWSAVTSYPWVLSAVRGYSLELDCQPRQAVAPPFTPPPPLEAEQVEVEISKLLNKAAVRKASPCTGQFVSRIFMVTKKDGSCRLVVNLKPLNRFVTKKHFKMENAAMVWSLLRKDDWMTTIDLKDAFLSVPIQADHRKFLRFQWKGALYKFQCLPFGLTSTPRVFTKLLRPVMAVLRRQGIRCMIFIDDLLLLHPSREELKKITAEVVTMFLQLGFLINQEKSGLIPSQRTVFLGFTVDSVALTLSLPTEKMDKILQECSCSFCKTHHNQVPSLSHRASIGSNSGSVACPPLLQATPTPEERCFQEESVLRCQADPRPGSQTGPSLVADRGDKVEWQTNATRPSRPNSGIGCLDVGVGSQYVGVSDRRLVVLDGEKSPNKCPGNVGRDIHNKDLCQGPLEHTHPSQDGQHLSSGICESHGRDTISQTVGCCQGSVDMVPQQGDDCISRVPPRRAEHHWRIIRHCKYVNVKFPN